MSNHWERVRFSMKCAYGCEIKHSEWAYFGRRPFTICEGCAAKYGLSRPVSLPVDLTSPDALVPATPAATVFTDIGAIADEFAREPEKVVRAARRTRPRR